MRIKVLILMWVLTILEPQWWLASKGLGPVLQLTLPLFAVLAAITLVRLRPLRWVYAVTAFLLFVPLSAPFASYNRGFAVQASKRFVLFAILAIATATLLTNYRQAIRIILLGLLGQFVWWGLLGMTAGSVQWHPHLGNYDGFGPLMVIGFATTYYTGLSTRGPLRWIAFATTAVCGIGVVASFARGAVVSLVLVLVYVWLRSPRKLVATGVLGLGLGVMLLAATFVFDADVRGGNSDSPTGFWNEMATIDEEGGTGEDRMILWRGAWQVFTAHPILGAGMRNFGPAAVALLDPNRIEGIYAENFGRLYERTLHNSFFQILSEFGIAGSALFLWALLDFWKRNRAMRTPHLRTAWKALSGGRFDLRALSLAFEGGLVGFLATAFFYNQLEEPWLLTLLVLNGLTHALARRAALAAPTVLQEPVARARFRRRGA